MHVAQMHVRVVFVVWSDLEWRDGPKVKGEKRSSKKSSPSEKKKDT